jgi:dolichyl-phosphate-mannose--protein O-mannosyl transferase
LSFSVQIAFSVLSASGSRFVGFFTTGFFIAIVCKQWRNVLWELAGPLNGVLKDFKGLGVLMLVALPVPHDS